MPQLLVDVRPEHIAKGACNSAQECMIALAIKDQYSVKYAAVRTNCITVTSRARDGSGVRCHFAVPTKAAKAIIRFDNGEKVAPFKFRARMIDEKWLPPVTQARKREILQYQQARRQSRKEAGIPEPKYGRRARVLGV